MLQLGKLIGIGTKSMFFHLRDLDKGVKIRYDNDKKKLMEEKIKAGILLKLGLSVPKYYGIKRIQIPSYFDQSLDRQNLNDEITSREMNFVMQQLKKLGKNPWGSIMEIISSDVRLSSRARRRYLLEIEERKIKALGIVTKDLEPDLNIVWCPEKRRLVMLDFDEWVIPKKYF